MRKTRKKASPIGTHLAIESPLSAKQILAIAKSEEWRALVCSRGPYEVVEFWLENAVLLEVMAPEMQAQYVWDEQ